MTDTKPRPRPRALLVCLLLVGILAVWASQRDGAATGVTATIDGFFAGRDHGRFCIDPLDDGEPIRNVQCWRDGAQLAHTIVDRRLIRVTIVGDTVTRYAFLGYTKCGVEKDC